MKTSTLKYGARSIGLLTLLSAFPAQAADLAYAGRLIDAEGAPLAGPVDITLRFYGSAAGSDQLGPTKTLSGIPLDAGVFQLTVSLEAADEAAIFGDGTGLVFVEIEAAGKLYPRQRFTPVPLALRIPVDNDSLVYGSDAKLAVGEIAISRVQGLSAALAQKLDSTPASGASNGYLSSADWTTFSAKQDAITASSSLTAGNLTTASQDAVVIKPYGSQPGETGELRFEEKTGGNYVAFKAPDTLAANEVWTLPAADGAAGELLATDGAGSLSWTTIDGTDISAGTIGGTTAFAGSGGVTTAGAITATGNFVVSGTGAATTELRFGDNDNTNYIGFKAPGSVAANKVWTLPSADGAAGQFLSTNGAGTLAWGSPAGGGDMLSTANLADLANVATARTNLGLGSLATASAVGSAEITDSAVSSSDIADGTITNADISGAAQVATSKLSGAVTAISGHGLGALATASAVGSAEITDGTIANADISGTAQIATSKLAGALTSISGHGLGSLAALSSVSSSEITDGTIADADVSGTAQIATSKLSGAVTSIAGHGLGSLATLSAVGSTEITNGTIADADISATAAIATSKLSGAVTSIAGHGLGSLATLNAVGSAEITDGQITDADVSGTAAISSTKISFANDGISGDKIDGGTISNFASTGIDDNASANAVTINSAGNVGIGTTSPSAQLDVAGDLTLTSAGDSTITMAYGGLSRIKSSWGPEYDTNHLSFYVHDDLALRISRNYNLGTNVIHTDANVGIGTTSPAAPLDIRNSVANGVGLIVGNSVATGWSQMKYQGTGRSFTVGVGNASETEHGVPNKFYVYDVNTNLMRMIIDTAGNVGIGTTTPGALLHVHGTGDQNIRLDRAANTKYSNYRLDTAGVEKWGIGLIPSSEDLVFRANSASNYVTIQNSSGNVGIGTTTPGAKLAIYDSAAADGSQVGIALGLPNVSVNHGAQFKLIDNTSGSAFRTSIVNNGSEHLSVLSNGNVGIGTTTPSELLHVKGSGAAAVSIEGGTTTNSSGVQFRAGGNNYWLAGRGILDGGSNFNLYDYQGTPGIRLVVQSSTGNVGIGTTAPAAKVDVAGEIKLGNTDSTCNAANEGQQRYNSTSKAMEYCNGTLWQAFAGGGRSFGGMFQTSNLNCNINNPITGSTSCPSGFTASPVYVVNTSNHCTSSYDQIALHMCWK